MGPMKELEIELTIPSGMKLKGVRTEGNTIVAVVSTEIAVRRIGFIPEPNDDEEDDNADDELRTDRR